MRLATIVRSSAVRSSAIGMSVITSLAATLSLTPAVSSLAVSVTAGQSPTGTPTVATGSRAALQVAAATSPAPASADLAVTLSNGAAKPGHRVSYVIKIRNDGPSSAKRVQVDFTTSRALSSVRYQVSGRCLPSSRETACLLGTLQAGRTATVTVSGVLSKKLKKGDPVASTVTVASSTHLVNKGNDTAHDDYQVGIAKSVAPSPSASPSHQSKLDEISNAATSALDFTDTAMIWSFVALGAAALWFAIGLTVKAYKRHHDPDAFLDG